MTIRLIGLSAFTLGGTALAATLGTAPASPTPSTQSINVDGYRSAQPVRPEKKPASRLPLATQLGFDFMPVPQVTLAPIDSWNLMLEDEIEVAAGAPLRYGVPRSLDVREEDGQWVNVPGGQLWRVEITAMGAENTRLQVEAMNLPKGAELRLFSPDYLNMVAGPFTDNGPNNNGDAWSMTRPGESVVVEYFEHARTQRKAGLPFSVKEVTHGYRPVLRDGLAGGAGNCHNHPACYAAWADIADASAMVLFGGGYLCSGQLIANNAQDETPYYITANHCIGSQSTALGAEFYFDYERTSCTGGYSNGSSVSSADMVAEWPSSDSTLLSIRGSLPANRFWVGWTTDSPGSGTDATCVHFPSGSHARISFGDVNSNPVCGSGTNWVGMSWNDGVTEGGSSGSGIYRDTDQRLFGVLTCGASSCSNQNGLDGYGRFNRAYENGFDDYLGSASSDDGYEENDTCSAAASMSEGTHGGLTVKSTDEDWYAIAVSSGATLDLTLDFVHANGDIDCELFASCGGTLLASGTSNNNDETMSWTNSGSGTTAYLRVFLYSGTNNTYSVAVNDGGGGGGGGGGCDGATVIGNGNHGFDTTGSSTTLDLTGYCDPGQYGDDAIYNTLFFEHTPDTNGTVTVSTCNNASFDTRLSVHGGDCEPSSVIVCLDDTDGCSGFTTTVTFDATAGELYVFAVGGYSSTDSGTGTLAVSNDGSGGGGDPTGTCCDGSSCSVVTEADCNALGGSWGGANTTCASDTCGGGGGCPDGEIEDCNGNCAPADWVGDTYCDDGTYEHNGVAIYFNCDEFDCDGGDCTDCGGGGGGKCEDGWVEDCVGTCFPQSVYDAWLGDGYCDDGSYIPYDYGCEECPPGVAIYMNCDEFDCDNGDCPDCGGGGGGGDCTTTTVTLGDNAVNTADAVGVTLDLTGYCDPGEFGTDALLNTAFFEFTPSEGGTVTVSTCNQAAWDTRLSAHLGDCEPASVITCLDDTEGCAIYTTTIEFEATAGQLYVIALGGYGAADYGDATLTIENSGGGGGGDPTGTCCVGSTCSVVTDAECNTLGGKWGGADTTCASDTCGGGGCVGDLNNNGSVEGGDLTILLGAWGSSTGGDLNNDGITDGGDLTMLLGAWGDC